MTAEAMAKLDAVDEVPPLSYGRADGSEFVDRLASKGVPAG